MENIKLVIFDLDGTLLDSVSDVHICVNYSLKQLGLPVIPLEHTKKAIGPGIIEFSKIVLGSGNERKINDFLTHYRVCYRNLKLNNTSPFIGVPNLLDSLSNYTLVVATNKPLRASLQAIKRCKLEAYFRLIVSPEIVKRPKPYPDMINYILENLDYGASQAIVVGDTRNDLLAARAAKVKICIAGWGYSQEKPFLKQRADFYLEKPSALFNVLYRPEKFQRQNTVTV